MVLCFTPKCLTDAFLGLAFIFACLVLFKYFTAAGISAAQKALPNIFLPTFFACFFFHI
jgi:hypothetical protein